jgi:hypothetical protein
LRERLKDKNLMMISNFSKGWLKRSAEKATK